MSKLVNLAPSEPKTGYTTKKTGDKHCSDCAHFEANTNECNGPKMLKFTSREKLSNGNVKVSPNGYCKFWEDKNKGE